MSFNRANVVWESADGTWNRGFYEVTWTGEDPEWDVEYDYGSFEWVTTGHLTMQAAMDAWDGSNPGSCDIARFASDDPRSVRRAHDFDLLAKVPFRKHSLFSS